MEIKLLENEVEWDNFVNMHTDTNIGHSLEYKKVLEETYKNLIPKYFILYENGEIKAIFPFFIVRSKIFGTRAISLPFLDSVGFLGEYDSISFSKIVKELRKENIQDIQIRLNSSLNDFQKSKQILLKNNFIEKEEKHQCIIKLKDEQTMWDNFHKHTRNDIRKAKKSNLSLKEINNLEEIRKYYLLYLKNMKNFGTPQHSISFFKNFLNKRENFYGLNCYLEKKLIGAIIVFFNNQEAYISFNVSEEKFRQYRPNDLLYWEIIRWCIKKNIKILNLGQINIKSKEPHAMGLLSFKQKWLGSIFTRNYFTLNPEKDNQRTKKFRVIWKKLPLFIIKKIGPKITSELAL